MKKIFPILVIIIIIFFVCTSGCTNKTTTEQTPAQTVQSISITTTPTQLQTTIVTLAPTSIGQTINTTQNETKEQKGTSVSTVNPYITQFKVNKSLLTYEINNCVMKEVFPAIANDPNYGFKASPPKLSGISWGEFNVFIRDYTEGKNENSKTIGIARCINPPPKSPQNPDWTFVEVSATLTPRNVVSSNYEIVFHIYSQGKDVTQINMNETLYQDQPAIIETFIPVRDDEMDMFDSVELKFNE
ncbi:MAG: hypothetical protein ABR887_08100 [Methanoregulaceae archaeon]|jgi:hypothetical protein